MDITKLRDTTDVINILKSIATCPVCFEELTPDLVCCIKGHAICKACKSNLKKCPTCRAIFMKDKPTCLSQLLEVLRCCCRHAGCHAVASAIENHERCCPFRQTICRNCPWSGLLTDFLRHFRTNKCTKHFVEEPLDSTTYYIIPDFTTKSSNYNAVTVYDNIFLWRSIHNDIDKNTLTFTFVSLPLDNMKGSYQLKLSFGAGILIESAYGLIEEGHVRSLYRRVYDLNLSSEEDHVHRLDTRYLNQHVINNELVYTLSLSRSY